MDYTGESTEKLALYEFYEYVDTDSGKSSGGIGAGGGAPSESFLVVGNMNGSESFRISLSLPDGKGESEYSDAGQNAMKDGKGGFPDASGYAVSTGSIVIVAD